MAEIHSFRGVHYNQTLMKDLPAVICPPYDIITPQRQQELYSRSEHNFVRLELAQDLPQDTVTNNKYTRSAATMEQWLREGVLETDETPAVYLYNQFFTYQGRKYRRRSLIARVRVEPWERMVVRPHEGTTARAKDDRLNLLWALQANTSPILTLFQDDGQQISSLLAAQERNNPLVDSKPADGEGHRVWAITEPGVLSQISSSLAGRPLYIADGHHRYESSLAYRRERSACSQSASGDEAFNFVMVALVAFSDPGLVILPPHRLVRGLAKSTLNGLRPKLEELFEIEELPLNTPDVWKRIESPAENKEIRLVLFGLDAERFFVLKPHAPPSTISQMMPHFHSELYRNLDVSIVDHIILEKLLAVDSGREQSSLAYSYDRQDAVGRVSAQEYQLALLLDPPRAEVIKAIADAGDKMPRKSTYFYPKLPSGLVLNRLV